MNTNSPVFTPSTAPTTKFTPSAREFVPPSTSSYSSTQAFTPSSREFVPSGGVSSAASASASASGTGFSVQSSEFRPTSTSVAPKPNRLRSAGAAEFVPSNQRVQKPTTAEFLPGRGLLSATQQQNSQQMQQLEQQQLQQQSVQQTGRSYEAGEMPSQYFEPPPSIPAVRRRTLRSIYMPDHYRDYFALQSMHLHAQVEAGDEILKMIPKGYHCVSPLDVKRTEGYKSLHPISYPSSIFKVVKESDGTVFAMRRVDKLRTTKEILGIVSKAWSRLHHPCIVKLHSTFIHKNGIFFLHEYHPGSQSLLQRFFTSAETPQLLPEPLLWRIACSLSSGLRAIHGSGLASRCVNITRVIITGHGRARLANSGVLDVLEFESRKGLQELQAEDVIGFGRLLLQLACLSTSAESNVKKSLEVMSQNYSNELTNLIGTTLLKPVTMFDVANLTMQYAGMALTEGLYQHTDACESLLQSELENGRLLLLMLKLGTINERPAAPQTNPKNSWSETGNRYMLKLFRDYVFHQVDEEGRPSVDWGHIVSSLNKLDAGSSEKIVLMSRDEKSLLVVSFADVRRVIEETFGELVSQTSYAQAGAHQQMTNMLGGMSLGMHDNGRYGQQHRY